MQPDLDLFLLYIIIFSNLKAESHFFLSNVLVNSFSVKHDCLHKNDTGSTLFTQCRFIVLADIPGTHNSL